LIVFFVGDTLADLRKDGAIPLARELSTQEKAEAAEFGAKIRQMCDRGEKPEPLGPKPAEVRKELTARGEEALLARLMIKD
jgi:hypothetical protein